MDLPREFAVPRWQVIANFAVGVGCLALAFFALRTNQAGAFPGFVVVGLGITGFAVLLASTRVRLSESELLVTGIFGTSKYARNEVLAVDWEHGKPVSIEVAERGWMRLPYLGAEPTELHVALKYWIPVASTRG